MSNFRKFTQGTSESPVAVNLDLVQCAYRGPSPGTIALEFQSEEVVIVNGDLDCLFE